MPTAPPDAFSHLMARSPEDQVAFLRRQAHEQVEGSRQPVDTTPYWHAAETIARMASLLRAHRQVFAAALDAATDAEARDIQEAITKIDQELSRVGLSGDPAE